MKYCEMTLNASRSMLRVLGVVFAGWLAACAAADTQTNSTPVSASETYSFVAAGDMRSYVGPGSPGKRYFDGVCETLKNIGPGKLMISPGDCDPPGPVRAVIDQYLGTNYLWYPVFGNHEIESGPSMTWLHQWAVNIPHLTRRGPPGAENTIYSFDFGNSHFIALNEYYDGKSDGIRKDDLPEETFAWLEKDLKATRQPLIWIYGHTPIESRPDMDTREFRHEKDSVSTNSVNLNRFVQLMKDYHVRAYICGHTHCCSIEKVKGVWQADSGHSRGAGNGKGSPSTFLKFRVAGEQTWVDVYRADPAGENYKLRTTVELN
jgi:hypothetical protein